MPKPKVEPPVLTDALSDEDFLKMAFPHANITFVKPEADVVEPEPAAPQEEVLLKGAAIAVIEMNDGTFKHVIFHPTASTRKKVVAYEGENIDLSIEDRNGLFSPKRPQRIVDSVYEFGNDTMIVTTENQE